MDEKHFGEWIDVKSVRHYRGVVRTVREGEIWWCAVGENVGVEMNGKSQYFSRPVLVLRKLSRDGFMGIPLTSQPHEGSWYVSFAFRGNTEVAVLAQARVMSVKRLYKRMGTVPDSDLELVREGFRKLYC